MLCEEVLRQCNAALDRCLHQGMSDPGSFAAALSEACEHIDEADEVVKCISAISCNREQSAGERSCDGVREEYRSRLSELQSMLPSIGASLEKERGRLARELAMAQAVRSWAEFSQSLAIGIELCRVE